MARHRACVALSAAPMNKIEIIIKKQLNDRNLIKLKDMLFVDCKWVVVKKHHSHALAIDHRKMISNFFSHDEGTVTSHVETN